MMDDPRKTIGQSLTGDTLEVGPGSSPFPVGPDARVRYADRSVLGGRDANWPELIGWAPGIQAEYNINIDTEGLAPISDQSLDNIITCHVLEHLANPVAVLCEFERVLKVGGRLVLILPDRTKTFDRVRQPTTLAYLLEKFHRGVKEVTEDEIKEFCTAIYYQPPIHPPKVREWHNPHRLDSERMELHRRRSIHVHCWSPEEFASMIAGVILHGIASYQFSDVYFNRDRNGPTDNEFGLVLQRTETTGHVAASQFIRDWAVAVLRIPDVDISRIARLAGALRRDLALDDCDPLAALAELQIERAETSARLISGDANDSGLLSESAVSEPDNYVGRLEMLRGELEGRLAQVEDYNRSLEMRRDELEQEKKALEQAYDAMLQSRSWRMMAPLRAAASLLRKSFR